MMHWRPVYANYVALAGYSLKWKSSVCAIAMKHRNMILISIIISLGKILLSYIANTSRAYAHTCAHTRARTHTRAHAHTTTSLSPFWLSVFDGSGAQPWRSYVFSEWLINEAKSATNLFGSIFTGWWLWHLVLRWLIRGIRLLVHLKNLPLISREIKCH